MHSPRNYRRWNCLLLALITVAIVITYGRQGEAKESAGAATKEWGSTAATKPRGEHSLGSFDSESGDQEEAAGAIGGGNVRALKIASSAARPTIDGKMSCEKVAIQHIDIPFLQDKESWMQPGKGISMCSNGEPKSGTTWTERIITELALQLCGSPTNTWCQMGGLVVHPHNPAPSYVWEMLFADTGDLFLHFDGRSKHKMIGLDVDDCHPRGRQHGNCFEARFPCRNTTKETTRESISDCLPDTSEKCARLMPSRDPSILRISVVFRDPRDVVISEHRMRTEHYGWETAELSLFIYERFEQIVSWQTYRWMWHTTFYQDASHVMFYEDIKSKPEALADLASFMGLNSTVEQMLKVQNLHGNESPHGGFNTYGLPLETIEYMNSTMLKLSPTKMLDRFGLSLNSH